MLAKPIFHVYAPNNPRALPAEDLAARIRAVLTEEDRADTVPVLVHATPTEALTAARADASAASGIARAGAVPRAASGVACADAAPCAAPASPRLPRARVAVAFGTLYAIADLICAIGNR